MCVVLSHVSFWSTFTFAHNILKKCITKLEHCWPHTDHVHKKIESISLVKVYNFLMNKKMGGIWKQIEKIRTGIFVKIASENLRYPTPACCSIRNILRSMFIIEICRQTILKKNIKKRGVSTHPSGLWPI